MNLARSAPRAGSLLSLFAVLVPLLVTGCFGKLLEDSTEQGTSGQSGGDGSPTPIPPDASLFERPGFVDVLRPPFEGGTFDVSFPPPPDVVLPPPPDVTVPPPPDAGVPDVVAVDVITVKDATVDASPPPEDTGVDTGSDSGPFPASHSSAPTETSSGGPVLTTPNFIPVFFSGDTEQTTLTDFLTNIGASSYWSTTTSEYGVGPATVGTSIVLTTPAPTKIDDTAIASYLQTQLDGTDPIWGTAGPEDVFVIFYPSTTTITLDGYKSCSYFGGYHNETSNSLGVIHYAVLPRCAGFPPFTSEEYLTFALSHELIEASTDPQPYTDPAYLDPDANDIGWALFGGGEIGDMCAWIPNIQIVPPSPFAYTVQRTWSNASASASHDPCVPIPAGEVYFNSVPVLGDAITLNQGGPIATEGAQIPLGTSKTIPVNLFSDAPTSGAWSISAIDVASAYNGEATALTFSFDKTTGKNGDVVNLTINALRKDPQYGGELFMVVSTLGSMQTFWIGAVGN
jgi:hypothetical protein